MNNVYKLILISNLCTVLSLSAEPRDLSSKFLPPHHPNQLIVKWKDGQKKTISQKNTLSVTRLTETGSFELVKTKVGTDLRKFARELSNNPNIALVEPDYLAYINVEAPDDPDFDEQWGLNNSGQTSGTTDADINALEMWDVTTGNANIVIGVLDTGVNYTHEDIANNMWENPNEIADNGIDDDNNGYIDDIHGINAIEDSGDPLDNNGHGTHVAGIIAAEDNSVGVVGVIPTAKIIACKWLGSDGSGFISNAIKCLTYFKDLKDAGIDVLLTNNSWGIGTNSAALYDAIAEHQTLGILFIAAAGNSAYNHDYQTDYPSGFDLTNIISVASTDHNDALSDFSDYGAHSVAIGAPGEDIYSLSHTGGYTELSGTSMAAPHVSGLAGIIKASDDSLNWIQIKNLVLAGGEIVDGTEDYTYSKRRIRGYDSGGVGSLTCSNINLKAQLEPTVSNLSIKKGGTLNLTALNIDCADVQTTATVTRVADSSIISLVDDATNGDQVANDGVFVGSEIMNTTGTYNYDFFGSKRVTVDVYDGTNLYNYRPTTVENFNYRTITGTALGAGDETMHTVISPFRIYFAGDTGGHTQLYVASNGVISFTDHALFSWDNESLPENTHSSIVAPYWDDLDPSVNGDIFYEVIGTTPNRELVVEWRAVPWYAEPSEAENNISFQAVFFENSEDILFNYADTIFEAGDSANSGGSATVGLQSNAGIAVDYAFNEQLVTDNTGILWVRNAPPVANAGEDQTVVSGTLVTLDGRGSEDDDGDNTLDYRWRQTAGSEVTLSSSSSKTPTFSTSGLSTQALTFKLTVTDDANEEDNDYVNISIVGGSSGSSSSSGGGSGGSSAGSENTEAPNLKPSKPKIISPNFSETVDTLTPQIVIHEATDANGDELSYTIEVYDEQGNIIQVASGLTGKELSHELLPLRNNGVYTFKVKAFDGKLFGPSASSKFSIEAPQQNNDKQLDEVKPVEIRKPGGPLSCQSTPIADSLALLFLLAFMFWQKKRPRKKSEPNRL